MIAIWILLGFLLLFLYGKWVLLALLSPVIIYHCKRERAYSEKVAKEDAYFIKNSNIKSLHNEAPALPEKTISNRVKIKCYSLLNGFERYIIIQTGLIPGHHIRDFIYKHIFQVRMSKGSVIYYGAELRGWYNLSLSPGAIVGDKCTLDARRGYIKIGENVQLGNEVKLWTGSHDMNDPYFRSLPGKRGPIEIEDYVWIGPSVTVLHSVKIGKGAVISAGSVVTKDVEPFSIMAGIPAKKIGERNHDLRYDLSKFHVPFY